MDEMGKSRIVKGIPWGVLVRHISTLQLKIGVRKACEVYVVQILNNLEENDISTLTKDLVLREFQDFLSEEILGLPPRWDIDFTIDLVIDML